LEKRAVARASSRVKKEELTMRLRRITRIAFLILVAVLAFSFIAMSGMHPDTVGQVPFKGTLFLVAVPDPSDTSCAGALRLNISEVGHVTVQDATKAAYLLTHIDIE
jgi:hypothetical protein